MRKHHLLAPGPTEVPSSVSLAEAKTVIHHRTPQFSEVFHRAHEALKPIFKTAHPVYVLCASGTGAMETAVANTLSPGDRPIVVRGGVFGERWGKICAAYGIEPRYIDVAWGAGVEVAAVEKALREAPDAPCLFVQLSETSTGAVHDVRALAALTRRTETLLVVDAISGLGAMPLETDAWGVDIVLSGSQKSFMLPPGLAFITANERAWKRIEAARLPRFYFDLRAYRTSLAEKTSPWTPAISLVNALEESLRLMNEEGIDAIVARHARHAEAVRRGVRALGLDLFATAPGNVLTSVKVPEGVDGGRLVKKMRDEYGVTIAGGQGKVKGKIFRISNLGYVDDGDLVIALAAVERALAAQGRKVEIGAGVVAVQRYLAETGG